MNPTDYSEQSQQQNQTQSVNVNIGDALLEQRIFARAASAGRQLARMTDILDILVNAYESSVGQELPTEEQEAIEQFREMRKAVLKEKSRNSAEQIMRQLKSLYASDSEAYATLAPQLRVWLDQH